MSALCFPDIHSSGHLTKTIIIENPASGKIFLFRQSLLRLLSGTFDSVNISVQSFLQNELDTFFLSLDLFAIPDPDKPDQTTAFYRHGSYSRKVFLPGFETPITLLIPRIKPVSGGPTHAVLPFYLCPWSSFSLPLLLQWVLKALKENPHAAALHFGIPSSTVTRIYKRFCSFSGVLPSEWHQWNLDALIRWCLSNLHRTFLQPLRFIRDRQIPTSTL